MTTLQLLTPDPDYCDTDPGIPPLVARGIEQLASILRRDGFDVVPVPLLQARPVAPTLALLAWGYHLRPASWLALLAGWPDDVALINPRALMRWNTDKLYLAQLERAGVPIVPTHFVEVADDAALAVARDAFAGDTLIVKPRVSGGAFNTVKLAPSDAAPGLRQAMIQPFLASIVSEGELSLVYVAGRFSHALRKRAARGEFRIQEEFGGRNGAYAPEPEALAVAGAALAACPLPPTYARIDLIRRSDGRLALMEMELIEPDLFLDFAPENGAGLGAAIRDALR